MLKYLNSPILTLTALTAFLALAHYSTSQQGYTHAEIASMTALVQRETNPQSTALMDVWQLSEADVIAPVKIWGEK